MFPLFFLGDSSDRRIPLAFLRTAKQRYSCGFIFGDGFCWESGQDFFLAEETHAKSVNCRGGLCVLKDSFAMEASGFCCDCICVVNSQNSKAMEFAATAGLRTITCGSSPYDTLTFSSLTREKATVSLQRQVLLPGSGKAVEPAEYTFPLTGERDIYTILAVAAGFILSGHGEELSQLEL